MNGGSWIAFARGTAWISGLAVAVLSLLLIGDGILEARRASVEKADATDLELRTPREATASEELAALTERHTERSLGRKVENRQLAWGLLLATAVFLSAAKAAQTLGRSRPLQLVTLGGGAALAPSHLSLGSGGGASAPAPEEAVDLAFVDRTIAEHGGSREMAIPILQAMQSHFRYLPHQGLLRVCETTEIEPAQIIGVASFYSQFRRDPVGRYLVRVCHGTACHVAGVGPIMDEMRRRLQIAPDADTDPQRRFTLESVNCLGCCSLAPVMMVEDHVAGHLTPTGAWEELLAREAEG